MPNYTCQVHTPRETKYYVERLLLCCGKCRIILTGTNTHTLSHTYKDLLKNIDTHIYLLQNAYWLHKRLTV